MKPLYTLLISLFLIALSEGNAGQPAYKSILVDIPCQIFPPDNILNTPIDKMPVHPNSDVWVQTIGAGTSLHPDFGAAYWNGAPSGIPYAVVPGSQPKVNITFDYSDESDPGPYPIPPNPPIEGGDSSSGDRHILIIDKDNGLLYETWSTYPQTDGSWKAGSGAIFDLNANKLRPVGWTSSDAAGLPVLPLLLRYEDVASGEIKHAIRFTVPKTQRAFLWPARHYASSLTDTKYPPMGARFRLKASFDESSYSAENQVILNCLKKYGMILADNGSAWFITGAPDSRWNDDDLNNLKKLKGSDFEAIDESSLMIDTNSAQAIQATKIVEDGTINSTLISPNPFSDECTINMTGIESGFDVFDALGQHIDEIRNSSTWTSTKVPAGIYFIVPKAQPLIHLKAIKTF